jgi:hypothetical protein
MRQHPQGRDAAKCYAPASIVELLRADIWPPALQLVSRRAANRDHGRADAPAARAPLDFGKVLRSSAALTLQRGRPGRPPPTAIQAACLSPLPCADQAQGSNSSSFFMGQPLTSFVRTSAK